MEQKQAEKTPKKSFMAVGPTLHYSHGNVQRCWSLAVVSYTVACLFWSKILTGSFWSFSLAKLVDFAGWQLGPSVVGSVSIFEYPWQILVLGLLVGILSGAALLTSQLMSFVYSIPMILAVVLVAGLPGLGISLVVSCIAIACRPLRFRSRFVALALCTAPMLVYLGMYGGSLSTEPIRWGLSYTPWMVAWLVCLGMAGMVLGVGHFTRYRPGLVWTSTTLLLLITVVIFQSKIGFDELDYQIYVVQKNPENVTAFYDHSITAALDKTMTNPEVTEYLAGFFYPSEPIALRAELKREIQVELEKQSILNTHGWPSWFIAPEELRYKEKRQELLDHYDKFITLRPNSKRMPVALYYKALLSEYTVDIEELGRNEILHFYSDYPFERNREVWYQLYHEFGESPESLEARWRIAKHWAGQGRFTEARQLLSEAKLKIRTLIDAEPEKTTATDMFLVPFQRPAKTVMTLPKLQDLCRRLGRLSSLISEQNLSDDKLSYKRLEKFVMLNPHSKDYSWELEKLRENLDKSDPLYDNILLAQAMMIADDVLRAENLGSIHERFRDSDGGCEALYELGRLKMNLWRQYHDMASQDRKKFLSEARATLAYYLNQYPTSIYADLVRKNLADLPNVE